MTWLAGDVSGSEVLTSRDHLYEDHINQLRQSGFASAVVGRTSKAQYYCDGVADNVQIQEAIDAVYAAGGGTVLLKAGTYTLAAIVNLKSNVDLVGEGYGTEIVQSSNRALKISGHNNISIRNLRTDADAMTAGNFYSIYAENCQNIRIDHCRIENASGFAIFVTASSTNVTKDIWITDSYVSGKGTADVIGGGPAVSTATVSDVFVERCIVVQDASQGTGHPNAIDFVATKRVKFNNNITEGSIIFGSEQVPYRSATISNNIVKTPNGGTYATIGVVINSGLTPTGENIVISNNTIDGGFIDLFCNPTTPKFADAAITGNVVYANGVATGSGQAGIRLVNSTSLNVSDNTIYGSTGDAIWSTNVTESIFDNNIIHGSSGYDLRETGTCDGNRYTDNHITAAGSGATSLVGANNVVRNNSGINPDKLYAVGNSGTSKTIDRVNGYHQTVTMTGNCTFTFTDRKAKGDLLTLELTQDGTGSRTATWPSNFKKAGGTLTLTTTAGVTDVITARWDGTNWVEVSRALNVS
jgi:hypothetical protein